MQPEESPPSLSHVEDLPIPEPAPPLPPCAILNLGAGCAAIAVAFVTLGSISCFLYVIGGMEQRASDVPTGLAHLLAVIYGAIAALAFFPARYLWRAAFYARLHKAIAVETDKVESHRQLRGFWRSSLIAIILFILGLFLLRARL